MKGKLVKALPSSTLNKLICDTKIRKKLLDEYVLAKRLLVDSEGKKTRPVPSGISNFTLPRAYCFLLPSKNKN